MSTTAPAFFGVNVKSGLLAAARWTNSATDAQSIRVDGENSALGAGSGSGGTGNSCSP